MQILELIFHYQIMIKKINFQKDILPHVIAVSVFLLLTIIFYHPAFFENKTLSQSDISQWRGSAKELLDYREKTSQEGLWTNAMFGGMPGYLINVKWGNDLMVSVQKVISFGMSSPYRITYMGMLCFYVMLLSFRVNPYLAILGAITYSFSSYNIVGIAAGHNSRIAAIAFIPLFIAGTHLCFTKNKWLGAGLAALALAMQLRVNHLQITYYLALIVFIYGLIQLFYAIKSGTVKLYIQRSALLIGAVILAAGTFIGQFYTIYEYGKLSIRGKSELTSNLTEGDSKNGLSKSYVFEYSNGITEPLTLLVPNILGGPSAQSLSTKSNVADALKRAGANQMQLSQQLQSIPTYWGDQRVTSPYYAGAVAIFLFVIGTIYAERKYKIWLITLTLLGIMLSWGDSFSGFNYFMFDYFPGYNKFRSPTFAIIFPVFGISLLGMLGLEKLLSKPYNKTVRKNILIALACTGGLSLILALLSSIFSYSGPIDEQLPDWFVKALMKDRKELLKADAFRAFGFTVAAFVLLYLFFLQKLSRTTLTILFIIVGTIDIALIADRYLDQDKFQRKASSRKTFTQAPADKLIDSQKKLGDRVLNLNNPFNEARTSYFHHSVGGYHAAKLRRYQELIENGIAQDISGVIQQLRAGDSNIRQFQTLNMLNTKFIIVSLNDPNGVIVNQGANGPAWFVQNVTPVNTPDEELNKLQTIDTKTTAIIDDSKFKLSQQSFSADGSLSLVGYEPGYWKYESNNSGNGMAVFSEIYYPKGFEAKIDGQPAKMLRVNYVLRALEIPAGKHTIEFNF